jgi:hypothetical protein
VENADRLVAGFLEMFEEGCHKMVSSIVYWHRLGTLCKPRSIKIQLFFFLLKNIFFFCMFWIVLMSLSQK